MSAGFLFKGVCYPSLAEATGAHWTSNPAFMNPGSTSYISDFVWSGSAWVVNVYSVSGGSLTLASSSALPALTFENCDTKANFDDGMLLGWGVAAAMVAAYAIKVMGFGLNR